MEEQAQKDIRSLLKTFGIQADEVITAHLVRNPNQTLNLRITLEDLTNYGSEGPDKPLILEIEGQIRHL